MLVYILECFVHIFFSAPITTQTFRLVAVRRVPPQFSIPPPTMEKVKVGENISIACVAIGSPMPYVKWRRGKTTELSPEDKLPVGRNVLNLTNVEASDNYTCIAASSLGMIEATTFIKVLSESASFSPSRTPSPTFYRPRDRRRQIKFYTC